MDELSRTWQRVLNTSIEPDDTADEVKLKEATTALLAGGALCSGIAVLIGLATSSTFALAAGILAAGITLGCGASFFLLRKHTVRIARALIGGLLVSILLLDYSAVEKMQGWRAWPLSLLLREAVPKPTLASAPQVVAVVCIAWVVLIQAELGLRFGILDLPGTASDAVRRGRVLGCESPPCDDATRILCVLPEMFILLIFSRQAGRGEVGVCGAHPKDTRVRSVAPHPHHPSLPTLMLPESRELELVTELVSLLCRFAFDEVSSLLDELEEEMSPQVVLVFRQVCGALRVYRPYIPEALLDDDGEVRRHASKLSNSHMSLQSVDDISSACTDFSASTASRGVASSARLMRFKPRPTSPEAAKERRGSPATQCTLAIVFTDVKSSSLIWEAQPDVMRRALRIHNAAVRQVIDAYKGYEVKTIGDAFMVVFDTALEAVTFSLQLQRRLLKEVWPPGLLDIAECRPDSEGLWGGLTVRIGVHYGDVTAEVNVVGGRVDFFGSAVNQASRVENWCPPGMVCITRAVLDAMEGHPTIASCDLKAEGEIDLRGIASRAELFTLLPPELGGRRKAPELPPLSGPLKRQSTESTPSYLSDVASLGVHTLTASYGSSLVMPFRRDAASSGSNAPQSSVATVAWVDVSIPNAFDDQCEPILSAALQILQTCADRTEGKTVTVLGSNAVITWNALAFVDRHIDAAFHFSRLVDGGIKRVRSAPCHIGVVTGPLVSGKVGTSAQRFLTVIGEPINASVGVARMAKRRRARCCFALLSGEVKDWPRLLRANLVEDDMQSFRSRSSPANLSSRRLSNTVNTSNTLDVDVATQRTAATGQDRSHSSPCITVVANSNLVIHEVRMDMWTD